MFENTSIFGYQSENPVDRAAYDMMVMSELGVLDADRRKGELNADLGENQTYERRYW